MEKDPAPFEHKQDTQGTHVNTDDNLVVPVIEEDMAAYQRPVERGAVRIHKDVIEEQQSLDVPVTNEEVNVSRRVVNRAADPADIAFEEETTRVPLRGEEVVAEKRTRIAEEIDVDKAAVTHNAQVTETVRREEVVVDGENELDRRNRGEGRTR
jgi:uncharacterized protein (TIGR02271 family)